MPIAFAITFFSARIQGYFNRKSVAANVALESGVQECIESLQDLKANNAEESYLKGLGKKIDYVEKRHIITELGTALFVVSSTLILKFGIATVALVGSALLIRGEIDIPLFFMFLLVASRLYAPLEGALQNLAAIISTKTNIDRMNEILDQPVQTGGNTLTNKGYDIVFDHVGFAYNTGETVLKDVSFTAKLPDGYHSMIGENGCELSGGERQRISIARAFLKNSPIILLDEATASLDVENETMIQAALSRLIKDKTVLVIAHRMRTVSGADKVVVLTNGVVAEQGTPEKLMNAGKIYPHMVKLQMISQDWGI